VKLNRRRFLNALVALPATLFGAKKLPAPRPQLVFNKVPVLPPGYREAIHYNVAYEMAAMYPFDMNEALESAMRYRQKVLAKLGAEAETMERTVRIVDSDGTRRTVKINEGL
jgi:hypothetical protein